MSQIPRSQFALKKRNSPMVTIPMLDLADQQNIKVKSKSSNGSNNGHKNGSGNGHKNGSFDDDVVIIEDDHFAVVQHEEVVTSAAPVELSPAKKKRSRKSKDSTESKDSDASKKTEEAAAKSSKKASKSLNTSLNTQEEILVQPDEVVESAAARELKIVKLTDGLSRRSDRLQNASTFVNVSTVSSTDQSTKVIQDDTLETPPSVTERRIGGRRSTRAIDDLKFSYRSPTLEDSLNGTTNATVGSDFNNDSMLNTPATDRKRRPITDSMENIDSPKRSRLDLSGLFSSFSSPVAMLRNRFRRTNIASTPIVGKAALLNESIDSLNTTSDEMKEVDLKEVDLNEKEEVAVEAGEELKVITTPIKKTACVVM